VGEQDAAAVDVVGEMRESPRRDALDALQALAVDDQRGGRLLVRYPATTAIPAPAPARAKRPRAFMVFPPASLTAPHRLHGY
jgi:hypothetical protein